MKFYPQDVLFFRNGQPFNAGENTVGKSHYPFPSVFYGALRTALIGENIEEFKNGKYSDFIGTPTSHGKFRSWGPFLFKDNGKKFSLLFPMPLNLSVRNGKFLKILPSKNRELYEMKIGDQKVHLHHLWYKGYEPVEKPERELINDEFLKSYLDERKKLEDFYDEKEKYYEFEERIGIRIDPNTKSAEDKMFYRISTYRFIENCGFATFVENDDEKLKNVKSVFLGGKRHLAFTELKDVEIDFPEVKNRFFLYLVTPAVFKNGLLPSDFDGKNVTINGKKCKLISIASSKPTKISTYDMVKNEPRALKLAVPAGSVYFFESEKELNLKGVISFTDEMEEYGFGRAFIGGWNYVD